MNKEVLAILPKSIGGRLTTSSIIDGFIQNGFEVTIFDELKDKNFKNFIKKDYDYILGYDFSCVKLKIDYNLKYPCIAYFSDVIQNKTAGAGYKEYYKFLENPDIYLFYWDRELAKKEKRIYQPHFVNCEIYKDFLIPKTDIAFMGRLDTDLRLNIYIELNKKLLDLKFKWYAIEKHFLDALKRCNDEDKKIIEKTYCGFIDNEKDMAYAINDAKIIYNVNSQGVSSLNYRTFQTCACKRLLISDKRDELDLFNNIIPTYNDINDLAEKIKYYIENSNEYEKITSICMEIIQKKYNSKTCVKNMLDIIQK